MVGRGGPPCPRGKLSVVSSPRLSRRLSMGKFPLPRPQERDFPRTGRWLTLLPAPVALERYGTLYVICELRGQPLLRISVPSEFLAGSLPRRRLKTRLPRKGPRRASPWRFKLELADPKVTAWWKALELPAAAATLDPDHGARIHFGPFPRAGRSPDRDQGQRLPAGQGRVRDRGAGSPSRASDRGAPTFVNPSRDGPETSSPPDPMAQHATPGDPEGSGRPSPSPRSSFASVYQTVLLHATRRGTRRCALARPEHPRCTPVSAWSASLGGLGAP